MNSELEERAWYKSKYACLLIVLALLGSFANILYSIGTYNWPSGDESFHYSYSQRYYETGETERETVHNYNSTTPVVLLNVSAVKLYERYTGKIGLNKRVARSIQVIWYALLVVGIGVASFYLAGGNVAWWSVFLLLLDPNLNAHSALIGSDIPFVSMSMWVLLAIFGYLNKPNILRASLIGVAYGLAFCTKYSATFYALPIFLALLTVVLRTLFNGKPKEIPRASLMNKLARLFFVGMHGIVIVLLVTLIVNIAYSFTGTGQPLTIKVWYTELFKAFSKNLGTLPVPWPITFLSGFDHQLSVERIRAWNVVLLGKHFPDGIWYYFLVTWVTKTTIGVVALAVIILGLSPGILKNWRNFKSSWLIVFITWISLLAYFSFIFRTQVGMRYAYPCLPLAYILMAGYISVKWSSRWQANIALAILLLAFYERAPYFGNGISFTNSIVANKKDAYRLIADSNIDWFHNYPAARDEATAAIGEYAYNPAQIVPGNNLFTLNKLTGVMHNFDQYQWVRDNLETLRHFQHTHLLYYVSKEKFEQYINSNRTFSETTFARSICGPEYKYKNITEYPFPTLSGSWARRPSLYSGCLEVSQEALFEVKIKSGSATIGTYPREYDRQGLSADAGSSLWFKFKPGMHPICANVRDTSALEFIQHSGQAKFALRIGSR